MATLDWHAEGDGGVTLVHLCVTSEVPERVRIDSRLEPVWPPRRQGVPAAGWDEEGFEGVVTPEKRLVLGYASPADPVSPPAEITSTTPADRPDGDSGVTARDVVRTLGDPTPTRAAVADPPDEPAIERTDRTTDDPSGGIDEFEWGKTGDGSSEETSPGETLGDVDAWLDSVAGRVEDAERLAEAGSLPEATAAVEAVGGGEDVASLRRELATDSEQLQRVIERSRALAERIEGVDVPVETLQQLT
jgi:hypothetical protein